jgi:hypothetical protein
LSALSRLSIANIALRDIFLTSSSHRERSKLAQ